MQGIWGNLWFLSQRWMTNLCSYKCWSDWVKWLSLWKILPNNSASRSLLLEDERKKPARQALRMKKKNCFTTNIMSHAFLCLVIILSHNQVSCWLAILSLSLSLQDSCVSYRKKRNSQVLQSGQLELFADWHKGVW